jgi:ACS family glucarate transporter-like MFS transporter
MRDGSRGEVTRIQTMTVALMVTLSALSYFDRTIMSIAAPNIMREFGISETAMGSVFSALLLSYTLLMTPGGWLADRFGPRAVLTAAGFGVALLTGVTAYCGNPGLGALLGVVPSFQIVRFLLGAMTAPLYPSCGRMAANWIPTSAQGSVQALIMAGAAVGSATSPIAFSRMMEAFGWRTSFLLAAAVTAAVYAVWFLAVRDHPPGGPLATPKRASGGSWRKLLANRNLMMLTAGYFLLNYFEYIFFYWIYYYFGEIRHLGTRETALATTVLFITMAVMTPIGGKISDVLVARRGLKFGRRSVAMAGMALSAVLLFLGAGGFGVIATVTLLSLALGCATCSEGPFWATAIDVSGENVGAACGILNTGGNLGGLLAPVVTPLLASRFGWAGGLYFGSLMVLIGTLTWLLVDPGAKTGGKADTSLIAAS